MPTIFDLAWLIPLLPLLAFFCIALFTWRRPGLSRQLALLAMAIALVLALFTLLARMVDGQASADPSGVSVSWFTLGARVFSLGIHVDALSAIMLPVVSLVSVLALVWDGDATRAGERRGGYFALLSLLAAGALGLLVTDNLLPFAILWGLMDACAFLLVGSRRACPVARSAGLRVALSLGVGDLFLLGGLALVCGETGSLVYRDVVNSEALVALAQTRFAGSPFPVALVAVLFLLVAATIRAGQFPFHAWLPQAGEAPISAVTLIHTVTISTGVLLLVRTYPLLAVMTGRLNVPGLGVSLVTLVGSFTALFAALVTIVQRDLRRALSYAVLGQVGTVIAALGMGAYVEGLFHLIVMLFVAPLLFLAAGAAIQGMTLGRREPPDEEPFDPADMLRMGGLGRRQPVAFWTFFVGAVALAGLPFVTAGFWSGDAILARASAGSPLIFWLLVLAGGLTTFGAIRQVCLVFVGVPRSPAAAHVPECTPTVAILLVVLALFTVALGWIGIPDPFPLVGGNWFATFMGVGGTGPDFEWNTLALSSGVSVAGLAVAFLFYGWRPMRPGEGELLELTMQDLRLGWLYDATREGFYVGRLCWSAFGRGTVAAAAACDRLDGLLGRVGDGAARVGRGLAHLCFWVDVHGLAAGGDIAAYLVQYVALGGDWVDRRLGALAGWVGRAGVCLASVSGAVEGGLVQVYDLARTGMRVLSRVSAGLDRVLDAVTRGVGDVTRATGRWFLPRTRKVQSHLLAALVAVLSLVLVFVFLFARI